jgi:RNA polymerase sigma-70 factor, ECF subfamily
MGTLQACVSNVRRGATAPQRGKARSVGEKKTETQASTQLNSDRTPTPTCTGNDLTLVRKAIAGNVDAQRNLFARHRPRLLRTAFSLLHNEEDAKDAVQDGLCKAYFKLRSFQGRSSFDTWLTRIVINSALMARRKNKPHEEDSLDDFLEGKSEKLPGPLVARGPDPEDLCSAMELKIVMERHIRELPAQMREALQMRMKSDLCIRELAENVGIPTSALKSRVFRARRHLVRALRHSLKTG